jgi:transposase
LDEKRSFIVDWEREEGSLAELCRRYEISRQTGYKWLERYQEEGQRGLEERSRAPLHHPQAMPPNVRQALVDLRSQHPSWGPRKLRAYLERHTPRVHWPTASSIGDLLRREGLSHPRRRRKRTPPYTEPLKHAEALTSLSLVNSAFADAPEKAAAAAQTPQQVVISNTAVNPVPVTQAAPQYFQATQTVSCAGCDHVNYVFNVPSGKTLVVRQVNVFAGSYNFQDNFGVYMYPDNGSTSALFFATQPVGGSFSSFSSSWGTNQQVQMLATQTVQGNVRRFPGGPSAFSATITISGELIN